MKVLVMGLGLHGGGLETARYFLKQGAILTITDLRDEKTLSPSIEGLEAFSSNRPSIRYVLGKHEIDDFKKADLVIKNPGVRRDSPFLAAAARIETDISIFLSQINTKKLDIKITAITGSKGKSFTASAVYWALSNYGKKSNNVYLGGNITKSPLVFIENLKDKDHVVLELSSWQLGDLNGKPLLKPDVAVITSILPDHQDYYGSMEAYVNDKRIIYKGQDSDDFTVAADDAWGKSFLSESKAKPLVFSDKALPVGVHGTWLEDPLGPGFAHIPCGSTVELIPAQTLVQGKHQKQNLLAAGLALAGLGLPVQAINEGLGSFAGIEHRLELFHKAKGLCFYNDSAATIPEAAAAAVDTLSGKNFNGTGLILITGGTDKNLDFSPLVKAAWQAKTIILLAGTGSEKLATMLSAAAISFLGPFDLLENALKTALEAASPGDRILLSPGCASFGMFQNEFDRGNKWKKMVREWI